MFVCAENVGKYEIKAKQNKITILQKLRNLFF